MKTDALADGSLILDERLTFLRWGAVAGALGVVAVLGFTAWTHGGLTPKQILGGAAGFLALMGLAALVADRAFRFERPLGRVTWTVRRLFGTRAGSIPFSDVERIVLRSEVDTEIRSRPLRYTPMLVTRSGGMPLTSFLSSDKDACERLVRDILAAMGREGEAVGTAGIEDLVAAGRIVDAVVLARREKGLDLTAAKAHVDSLRAARERSVRGAA